MDIAIVGAGKLGKKLAYTLLNGNHNFTVIDTNEKKSSENGSPDGYYDPRG